LCDLKPRNPFYKNYEIKAFKIGLDLSGVNEMFLIEKAIDLKIIKPLDWELYKSFDRLYFEEV